MSWVIWGIWGLGCAFQANRIDREILDERGDPRHPVAEALWAISRIIFWPLHLVHEIQLRALVKLLPPPGDVV